MEETTEERVKHSNALCTLYHVNSKLYVVTNSWSLRANKYESHSLHCSLLGALSLKGPLSRVLNTHFFLTHLYETIGPSRTAPASNMTSKQSSHKTIQLLRARSGSLWDTVEIISQERQATATRAINVSMDSPTQSLYQHTLTTMDKYTTNTPQKKTARSHLTSCNSLISWTATCMSMLSSQCPSLPIYTNTCTLALIALNSNWTKHNTMQSTS